MSNSLIRTLILSSLVCFFAAQTSAQGTGPDHHKTSNKEIHRRTPKEKTSPTIVRLGATYSSATYAVCEEGVNACPLYIQPAKSTDQIIIKGGISFCPKKGDSCPKVLPAGASFICDPQTTRTCVSSHPLLGQSGILTCVALEEPCPPDTHLLFKERKDSEIS